MLCKKNLSFAEIPEDDPSEIFFKSSINPTNPKLNVTSRATHMNRLERSAHKRVVTPRQTKIKAPPIVGVPVFSKCDCGPSLRTDCPNFIKDKYLIIRGPRIRPANKDVRVANTALNVM